MRRKNKDIAWERGGYLVNLRKKYEERAEVGYFIREVSLGLVESEVFLVNGPMKKPGYVLDVGCGAGREAIVLTKLGYRIKAIDISMAMIEAAKKESLKRGLNIDFERLDITELNSDSLFDYCLFSSGVYNSIPARALRIQTLKRVVSSLKPQGRLFLPIGIARRPKIIFSRSFIKYNLSAGLKLVLGDRCKIEPGDALISRVSPVSKSRVKVFHHFFFSFSEIEDELEASGLCARMLSPGLWQVSKPFADDIQPPV